MRIQFINLTWDDPDGIGLDNIITDLHAINRGVGKMTALLLLLPKF